MKRRIMALALSLSMVISAVPGTVIYAAEDAAGENLQKTVSEVKDAESLGDNVALTAKASAAYTNTTGSSVANINNGAMATEDPTTTWNTWKNGDELEYPTPVMLTWDKEHTLSGMRVNWWADNANLTSTDNVTFPKSCQVQYLNADGEWVTITGMVNEKDQTTDLVGVDYESNDGNGINGKNKYWNQVTFPEEITTTSLRLLVDRNGSGRNGVGIGEWEVFGYKVPDPIGTGENVALNASVETDYTNEGSAKENINNGEAAADASTAWNTWKEEGDLEYPVPVTLTWEKEQEISSLRMMWWADQEKVKFPESCRVSYYDEKERDWVEITGMLDENGADVSSLGVKYDGDAEGAKENNRYWNGVAFKKAVKTKKLRLEISRSADEAGQSGIGIGEFEVYGKEVTHAIGEGTNIARKAAASADHENTPVTNVNNGSLATSNPATSWNTWGASANQYPTPVTLTWEEPYEIYSMQVMWWADNKNLTASGNVTFPKSSMVEYLNSDGEWVSVDAMTNESGEAVSTVGVKFDGSNSGINGANKYWNGVLFDTPIRTTKVRMLVDRNGSGSNGIGISEWQVFGEEITNELFGGKITGPAKMDLEETLEFFGSSVPEALADEAAYEWSIPEESREILEIQDEVTTNQSVRVKGVKNGLGTINLKVTHGDSVKETQFEVRVEAIESIDTYVTATAAGTAPILPKTVVANGLSFDDPTPSLKSWTKPDFDFAETFDSKLVPVEWEEVDPAAYAADQVGETFTVNGVVRVGDQVVPAAAEITVKEPVVAPEANSTVTFENVQLTDNFWQPKQKVNAVNSLNAGIYQIGLPSGGEPNFDNAIKKLNGEPYDNFQGFVFQDSDIYKSIEAISYTLSVIHNDTDPEMVAQREKLESTLARWIEKIEKVQYADGYINTHFTLRSSGHAGGSSSGTHRWRDFSNHEMYNAGHFFEAVVAYTRYREGIGEPDYSLYVVGKRFADEIVALFGPNGTRHEVPGHEEVELALVKLAKLVEEYEGEGTGQKYIDTVKLLIDRRGEDRTLRESGYKGGDYSQDARAFVDETNGVGHAVRANYYYAGVTDIATLLPDDDPDKSAYLKTLDAIWDSVANRKTYITGGIGVSSHGEDFGGDYELPNNGSYCETCAAIALANWNQRMNLVHEDAKYADVVERTLYNAILVGTNLEGNRFFYSSRLEVSNGNPRSTWFACACCPPNLMRTLAALSSYMYTVHKNDVFVNMYIGSDGKVNVGGTKVALKQETNYPWEGSVKLSVDPETEKEFTMKIRIPGWVAEQNNRNVTIQVNGEEIKAEAEKGYVAITRTWKKGDAIMIDMPMEIRKTEANPKVTTNTDRIALERGPVVYCMEKAGNAQLNSEISNFNPLNFVIPRDAELKAEYQEDLLKGVMEITGDVLYNTGDSLVSAKLQAVPYYAWNNRGDDGVYGQNSSSKMLIWTKANGFIVNIDAAQNEIGKDETLTLTGKVASESTVTDHTYAWTVKEGDSAVIVSGADTDTVTVKGVKNGTTTLVLTVTNSSGTQSAEFDVNVKGAGEELGDLGIWIEFMENLNGDEYTAESWAALQTALDAAKKTDADETASRDEINQVLKDLIAAFGNLEYGVQKQHLQVAVEAAEAILGAAGNYDQESLEVLRTALEAGKGILEDKGADQAEVNAAAAALIDAIVQVAKDADLVSLESLIAAVEKLDGQKYTADSFAALEAAAEAAREVLANPDRGESDLADAYKNVAAAIRRLVQKGNKAALEAVIARAEAILADSSRYAEATISGLDQALDAAKAVFENENADQEAVSAATKALTEELVKARLKGDVDGNGSVDTKDSAALLKYNAELADLDESQQKGADVNGDGTADTKDAALILQYAAEKISEF